MTRAQLRSMLRRQVQDESSVQWTDAELNEIINLAYSQVQKEIVKISRESHLFWDYMDTVAGTIWYPLPATFGISHVGYKASSSDQAYTILQPKRYRDIKDLTGSDTYYTQRGQWIGILPAPSEGVTSGIELVHSPIMSMGDDADEPRIKLPLHLAIVLWSRIIALGETDEATGETTKRLNEILGDISNWYEASSDEPDKLIVER